MPPSKTGDLKDILKEKCHRKVSKGVLFLHYNALAHWALATQKKLAYLAGPVGLAPAPWTEKQLKGHHFLSNAEVTAAVDTWFDGQSSEFF